MWRYLIFTLKLFTIMKFKALLLVALSWVISSSAVAQKTVRIATGETVNNSKSTTPIRLIENIEDGLRVTYTFEYAYLDSVSEDVFIVAFNSFGQTSELGQPSIPLRLETFEVPNENFSLNIDTISYTSYNFEIAPAREPEPETPTSISSNTSSITTAPGFFPENQVAVVGSQNYRGKKLCFINIYPVSYDHSTKNVRIANKIVYTITYNDTDTPYSRRKSRSTDNQYLVHDPVFNNVVLNAAENNTDVYGEIRQDYLVITTPTYKNAVNSFSLWKSQLGFNVHVSMMDKWPSDSEVKDSIDYYYNTYPQSLKYVLIVGNSDTVPATFIPHVVYPHLTDYYLGCPEDREFKLIPDVHRGRIPAVTNEEAENAFRKIKAYESCKEFDTNYFTSALHCAYFQNSDTLKFKYDTRRFVCTSEEIIETSRNIGIFPKRVYSAFSLQDQPTYYPTDHIYEKYGEQLPDELLNSDFNWKGSRSDIKSIIENKTGLSYILYRGHGSATGWGSPTYRTSDILSENYGKRPGELKNKMFPVVFSITCLSGKYDAKDCFATKSIVTKDAGSSCIIAATQSSMSGNNDAFMLGMFDAISPSPVKSTYVNDRSLSKAYEPVFRIGEILDQGLYRMAEKSSLSYWTKYTYELFHCFGDPSMMMWYSQPTPFNNVSFKKTGKHCTVKLHDGPAYIAFYDTETKETKCFYSDEAEYEFKGEVNIKGPNGLVGINGSTIIIYGPNRIPLIKNAYMDLVDSTILLYFTKCYIVADILWIHTTAPFKENSNIIITNALSGSIAMSIPMEPNTSETTIDVSQLNTGTYVVAIECGGQILDSKTIQKN